MQFFLNLGLLGYFLIILLGVLIFLFALPLTLYEFYLASTLKAF